MNPGIGAAFLYVHHCPFLDTCGIYPDDPQNTWLATTSADELGQKEDKIVLSFVEVHWGVHVHFSLVPEGALILMCRLGQVQHTLQLR